VEFQNQRPRLTAWSILPLPRSAVKLPAHRELRESIAKLEFELAKLETAFATLKTELLRFIVALMVWM